LGAIASDERNGQAERQALDREAIDEHDVSPQCDIRGANDACELLTPLEREKAGLLRELRRDADARLTSLSFSVQLGSKRK
jgi:hypothetical protein